MTPIEREVAGRLRAHSNRLFLEALREDVSSAEAQQKLRLREEIESHLLAMDALLETGATSESVSRLFAKLADRLMERQPV